MQKKKEKLENKISQEEITARALKMFRKGHKFGKLLYDEREELYDRF